MNTYILNWIRGHATRLSILLLCAAAFSAVIADGVLFPLILVSTAVGLAVFRYWDAIKAFNLWGLSEWVNATIDSIGIREWHAPYHPVEKFCNPAAVSARNEAAAVMNSIMMELVKDQSRVADAPIGADPLDSPDPKKPAPLRGALASRHADYEAARIRHDQYNAALARELLKQLVSGDLIAKGLPVQHDVAESERVIPISRWRIMNLDIAKADASGRGWHYTGIIVGKKVRRQKAK